MDPLPMQFTLTPFSRQRNLFRVVSYQMSPLVGAEGALATLPTGMPDAALAKNGTTAELTLNVFPLLISPVPAR